MRTHFSSLNRIEASHGVVGYPSYPPRLCRLRLAVHGTVRPLFAQLDQINTSRVCAAYSHRFPRSVKRNPPIGSCIRWVCLAREKPQDYLQGCWRELEVKFDRLYRHLSAGRSFQLYGV